VAPKGTAAVLDEPVDAPEAGGTAACAAVEFASTLAGSATAPARSGVAPASVAPARRKSAVAEGADTGAFVVTPA
jgi:hypothetical protein